MCIPGEELKINHSTIPKEENLKYWVKRNKENGRCSTIFYKPKMETERWFGKTPEHQMGTYIHSRDLEARNKIGWLLREDCPSTLVLGNEKPRREEKTTNKPQQEQVNTNHQRKVKDIKSINPVLIIHIFNNILRRRVNWIGPNLWRMLSSSLLMQYIIHTSK